MKKIDLKMRGFKYLVCWVILFFTLPFNSYAQNGAIEWTSKFDTQFYKQNNPVFVKKSTNVKRVLSFSKQGNSFNFMHLGPVINSLCLMFENTKDQKYLLSAHEIIRNVISSASKNRDGYQSWKVLTNSPGYSSAVGKEWILFEAHLFRYVVSYLYLVKTNSSEITNKVILNDNQNIINFVESNIWNKWLRVNNRNFSELTTFYGVRTHMGAQWAQIALGLSRLTASDARRQKYISFYKSYNKELRKNLILVDGSYIWNSTWNSSGVKELKARRDNRKDLETVQDVAHANQIVQYVIMAHEIDNSWTSRDLKYFSNTFKKRIIDSNLKSVHTNVDGSGKLTFVNLSDGWMKLGRYDSQINSYMTQYYKNNKKKIDDSPYSLQFYSLALGF